MASESTMNPEDEDESAVPAETAADSSSIGAVSPEDGPSEGVRPGLEVRPGTTDVQAYIGRQLRAVYDDVVKQPIPDRFLALMKQLEEDAREP